jgi:hypothetical protein
MLIANCIVGLLGVIFTVLPYKNMEIRAQLQFICDFIWLLKLICCCKGRSLISGTEKVPRRISVLAWSKL